LSAIDGYELVGTATTGAEAVQAAVTLRPHVLVMDIQMPDMAGIEATRQITRLAPDVAVLMLTMFDDDESVFAAMCAGARQTPGRQPGRSDHPGTIRRPRSVGLAIGSA
jgi:DNA-binding NarL/FixJ family response regulator